MLTFLNKPDDKLLVYDAFRRHYTTSVHQQRLMSSETDVAFEIAYAAGVRKAVVARTFNSLVAMLAKP